MKKLLFVYDMPLDKEPLWKDGLWAAIEELRKDFYVEKWNIQDRFLPESHGFETDFILGWGGFNSRVDQFISQTSIAFKKRGLCLGGYGFIPERNDTYDAIFYECKWGLKWLSDNLGPNHHVKFYHAFGINSKIYNGFVSDPIWDYTTVGAFSLWKRQGFLLTKPGAKLAIGEIQKGNISESMDIAGDLLLSGVTVGDMVPPEQLASIYRSSKTVYIPATEFGGGERAVLEARACGCKVEIESDNKKLEELLTCDIWDEYYYANQLKQGILSCL